MRKGSINKCYRRFAFVFIFLFTALALQAQNKISGNVADSKTANPLQGVTITVSGSTVATQTDANGDFSITVAPGGVLLFTSVNYATQAVVVGDETNISVLMVPETEKLSEVVIIGYGTTRKKDLTGAVTQISSDDFQSGQITSPEQLIAGKVAGVQVVSNGGAPGAGSTIRIRGGASLNASNDPLIVIDGVPVSSEGIPGSYSPLSLINPNDIASFTILKDASATAIYGSRASNGVIIITTKTGRAGAKPRFNFNSTFSVSEINRGANVLSAEKFRQIVNKYGNAGDISRLGTANTDWQNEIYRTALSTDNNLSISGGLKNMPYRVSAGYLSQQGVLKTGKLDRYTGGINVAPNLFNKHLKIDINLKGSISKSRFANQDAISAAVYFDPTKPVHSDNSNYNGYWEWLDAGSATGLRTLAPRNPLGLLLDKQDNSNVKRSIGNALIDYKVHFLPDLHAFLNVGYDYAMSTGTIVVDPNAAQSYLRSPDRKHGGVNNQYKQERKDRLLEAYLNYTKDISSIDTRIELVGGYAYQDFLTIKHNFADLTSDNFVMPGSQPVFAVDSPRYTLISYYGRANINIKDRYLLTGTIRTDGSSRFAEDQRWGVFPSGAFAWNIKNEGFMRNSKTFNTLKLRVGYGLTGQQSGIGLYDYNSFYGYSDNNSQYELGLDSFYHLYAPGGYYPQRTWEKTATTNLGLDFGFLNNRISGSVDVYYKKTTDLLNSIAQPAGSNFSNQIIANVGSMENRGIEVTLNLTPVKTNSVIWDLSLNGTYNKNKITNLTSVKNPNYEGNKFYGISGGTGNTIFINTVNYPRGSFYVYKQVYDASGMPIDGLFDDLNRDGIINDKDLYQYQKADPDYQLGLSTNLSIHQHLNVGFVMRASIGNYVYNNNISASSNLKNINNSLGFLTNGIAYNLVPGLSDKYFLSDYYIQNGSFVKLDNIYASYTFNKVFGSSTNLTLNANVQNVFTITNYIGLDPEMVGGADNRGQAGIDNNVYPRPMVMSVGVNLNF